MPTANQRRSTTTSQLSHPDLHGRLTLGWAERMAHPWRPVAVLRILLVAGTALALAACAATPSPSAVPPSTPELAAGQVTEGGITLAATVDPAIVAAGEEINVVAELSHDRPEPLVVSGSGSGIVFFSVTRVEDGLSSGPPIASSDCARHELPPGEPVVVPFSKSGGSSEDAPNADFLNTYFSEPELTLPPGTWRIDITTGGTLGEGCTGGQLGLELALLVMVTE